MIHKAPLMTDYLFVLVLSTYEFRKLNCFNVCFLDPPFIALLLLIFDQIYFEFTIRLHYSTWKLNL